MAARSVDENTWRTLLATALEVIDSLEHRGYGKLDFRLGGGTVLMLRFGHRLSKDIDIFTHDARALSFITPRLNDVAERTALAYEEQANAIKLILPEGDIDFIVAGPVIPGAQVEAMTFHDRAIPLDATAEILAKKLLYRADSFKARDVFDMATVLARAPGDALEALAATTRAHPALRRRLSTMQALSPAKLTENLLPTPSGRTHLDGMVRSVLRALDDAA